MPQLEPTTPEDIAWACARMRARADAPRFPPAIARGLEGNDPDQMRAAATFLIERGQTADMRDLVERFRNKKDFGVWARATSSRLYQLSGEFAAGLADIEDLMARFPERTGAHWFVSQSRCLTGLGRHDEAEAVIREGAKRFPDLALPRVFLANLLSRRKRYAQSLAIWRELIDSAPSPEAGWLVSLAGVLKALGRRHEAIATLEEFAAQYPGDRRAPPLLAQAAEDHGDWARALEIWSDYAQSFSAGDEPQVQVGRARGLFRLDRIEEAIAGLEAFIARRPDDSPALRELGSIALELGEVERARDILRDLTGRFGDISRPEWWVALARTEHDLRDYDAGAAALSELERRFPESALAENERLRLARELERGQDDLSAMVGAALRRFPEDFDLRSHWVWILLSLGRLEEAERHVEALEAENARGFALAARLRLEADRGDEALRAHVARLADRKDWDAADINQLAYAILETRTPWAYELGQKIIDGIAGDFAGNARLNQFRIRLMIARRQDTAALAATDAMPRRYIRRENLELRAWAAAKRDLHEEAKQLWRQAIATNYYPALHCPIQALNRVSPGNRPGPEIGITAYVVFRNEAAQIPNFLAHHRKLGVKRFVFFDHMSTDASRELLLNEPDVIVYDCPDSYQFSSSGRRWVNEVVAREGARGWGLQLDVDEYLVYPGCETVSIDRFVAYLERRGFEGVRGYMLDVFPPRLFDERGEPTPFEAYRYYDDDYVMFGVERPPYLQPSGGVRARLFDAKEFLHKTPMWRPDAGLLINSHETTHLRFADVSAALLHYKLMNVALRGRHAAIEAAGTAYVEADSSVDAMRRHSRYAARVSALWRADLAKPGVSRERSDSLTLADRGLMDISDDYRAWLAQARP